MNQKHVVVVVLASDTEWTGCELRSEQRKTMGTGHANSAESRTECKTIGEATQEHLPYLELLPLPACFQSPLTSSMGVVVTEPFTLSTCINLATVFLP